jgi:hypothetical protein
MVGSSASCYDDDHLPSSGRLDGRVLAPPAAVRGSAVTYETRTARMGWESVYSDV